MKNEYPEHEKLQKIKDTSTTCGDFYYFILKKKYITSHKVISFGRMEEILAEFFKIDLNKIEQEKRQMIDNIRKENIDANTK